MASDFLSMFDELQTLLDTPDFNCVNAAQLYRKIIDLGLEREQEMTLYEMKETTREKAKNELVMGTMSNQIRDGLWALYLLEELKPTVDQVVNDLKSTGVILISDMARNLRGSESAADSRWTTMRSCVSKVWNLEKELQDLVTSGLLMEQIGVVEGRSYTERVWRAFVDTFKESEPSFTEITFMKGYVKLICMVKDLEGFNFDEQWTSLVSNSLTLLKGQANLLMSHADAKQVWDAADPILLKNFAICCLLEDLYTQLMTVLPHEPASLKAILGVCDKFITHLIDAMAKRLHFCLQRIHEQDWNLQAEYGTYYVPPYISDMREPSMIFKAEFLSKLPPTAASMICNSLIEKVIDFFLKEASIIRSSPLGIQRMVADINVLKLELEELFNVREEGLYKALKAFGSLIVLETNELRRSAPLYLKDLPRPVILHHLYSRAPEDLQTLMQKKRFTYLEYSNWLNETSETEAWAEIRASLDEYSLKEKARVLEFNSLDGVLHRYRPRDETNVTIHETQPPPVPKPWRRYFRIPAMTSYLLATVVAIYAIVGISVYSFVGKLKGRRSKKFIDGVYFTVVTASTVGYGDLVPDSIGIKLFSCGFIVVGMIVDTLMDEMVTRTSSWLKANLNGVDLYAGVALIACVISGVLLFHFAEGFTLAESFYAAIVSMGTVGYGDYSFVTLTGRVLATIWLPLSTLTAARSAMYLREVWRSKLARKALERVMQQDYIADADLDQDGKISQAEFAIHVLREMKKITQEDVDNLLQQFNEWNQRHT